MNKNELPPTPSYTEGFAAIIVFVCGVLGGWICLYVAAVKLVGVFPR